jgi:L-ascorbate metabolism protein UlaG (beta-lactamase superfamily)
MDITWLGHSAFRITIGNSVVLIDPFLTGNPTFEKAGLDLSRETRGATHVALTHGHQDHIGDTIAICQSTGATLIATYDLASYLAGQGVADWSPGNHGGEIAFEDFTIAFTQAIHSSSIEVGGKPLYLGNPAGLVIVPRSGKTIYHMGDTAIFSDMALIQELYQPAIGLVPIGDRFTMGARHAALACNKYFAFEAVIPCHYGTFPIIDATADTFIDAMAASKTQVIVPKPGEPVPL